jgi:hypothetical protein
MNSQIHSHQSLCDSQYWVLRLVQMPQHHPSHSLHPLLQKVLLVVTICGLRKKQNLEIEICALTRQLRHYGRGGSDSRGVGRLKSCSAYLSISALACWLIFSPYAPHWRLWRDVMSTNFEVFPVRCSETHCHQAPGARTAGVEAPSSRGLVPQHARF